MSLTNDDEVAIKNMILEKRRYLLTLKCVLSIKHLCEKKYCDLDFKGCEIPFFYSDNPEEIGPKPDFICQKEKQFGIYGEVKGSLTKNTKGLDKEIDSLKRLNKEFIGWKTDNKKIPYFSIWLLIYEESIEDFKKRLQERENELKRDLILCSWNRMNSMKYESDIFRIKKIHGDFGIPGIGANFLKSPVDVEENDILRYFENIQFFNQEPPPLHIIEFLWMNIFPSFSDGDDFEITHTELYEKIKVFYPPWSEIEGKQEQVRISWIKKALDMLSSIKLAEKKENTYKINYSKNPGSNFDRKIASKLIKNDKKLKQRYIPQQKTLVED